MPRLTISLSVSSAVLRCAAEVQAGFEEIAVRGFHRLVYLELGHAVQNGRRLRPVFHHAEAIKFLKAEPDAPLGGAK